MSGQKIKFLDCDAMAYCRPTSYCAEEICRPKFNYRKIKDMLLFMFFTFRTLITEDVCRPKLNYREIRDMAP